MKYFVLGTLTDNDILYSLLGRIPKKSNGILRGYSVFMGDSNSLSDDMKMDIGSKRNLTTFNFLFAKKSNYDESIDGLIVEINQIEEKYFDKWERFPIWYQKENAVAQDRDGIDHDVYVYVQNIDGNKMKHFARIQGDKQSYVEAAKRLREKFSSK